jgi:hypothetical protein
MENYFIATENYLNLEKYFFESTDRIHLFES